MPHTHETMTLASVEPLGLGASKRTGRLAGDSRSSKAQDKYRRRGRGAGASSVQNVWVPLITVTTARPLDARASCICPAPHWPPDLAEEAPCFSEKVYLKKKTHRYSRDYDPGVSRAVGAGSVEAHGALGGRVPGAARGARRALGRRRALPVQPHLGDQHF